MVSRRYLSPVAVVDRDSHIRIEGTRRDDSCGRAKRAFLCNRPARDMQEPHSGRTGEACICAARPFQCPGQPEFV
jgi:hypothetical protein